MEHMILDYKALGQKFKTLRMEQKLSQETLAHRCNISASYLSHIEAGNRNLSLDTFVALCRELSVSSDFMLFDQLPKNDMAALKIMETAKAKGDDSYEHYLSVIKILAEHADKLE